MDQHKTEDGRREDLEQLETNPILGFIGDRIYPVYNTVQISSVIYYSTLTADAAAQTGRSAGAAPNRVLLSSSNLTFTCAELIKRYGVPLEEVKQIGGVEVSDELGGRASKRSVQRAMEEQVADALLIGSVQKRDILNSFIEAAQVALNAIRRYPGRSAFVASYTVFHRIMRYTEVVNRFSLSSAAAGGADARDIISRNPEALKLLLSAIIGVDEVLIGDDEQWYTSDADKQDRAAIVKLPDPEQFSHKDRPMFGKRILYLPDGQQPYSIESFYDKDTRTNTYDAQAHTQLQTFNLGAAYVLDGIDEDNTVTTTTTTT